MADQPQDNQPPSEEDLKSWVEVLESHRGPYTEEDRRRAKEDLYAVLVPIAERVAKRLIQKYGAAIPLDDYVQHAVTTLLFEKLCKYTPEKNPYFSRWSVVVLTRIMIDMGRNEKKEKEARQGLDQQMQDEGRVKPVNDEYAEPEAENPQASAVDLTKKLEQAHNALRDAACVLDDVRGKGKIDFYAVLSVRVRYVVLIGFIRAFDTEPGDRDQRVDQAAQWVDHFIPWCEGEKQRQIKTPIGTLADTWSRLVDLVKHQYRDSGVVILDLNVLRQAINPALPRATWDQWSSRGVKGSLVQAWGEDGFDDAFGWAWEH